MKSIIRGLTLVVTAAVLAACSSGPAAPTEAVNAEYITESSISPTASTTDAVLETSNAPDNEADAACFFGDVDFQGPALCITKEVVEAGVVESSDIRSTPLTDGSSVNYNDFFSSVQVAPGYRVEMYNDINFGGGGWFAFGDISNFLTLISPDGVNFNDKMSSFKVVKE